MRVTSSYYIRRKTTPKSKWRLELFQTNKLQASKGEEVSQFKFPSNNRIVDDSEEKKEVEGADYLSHISLRPVGIDKVFCELTLKVSSISEQMKEYRGEWKSFKPKNNLVDSPFHYKFDLNTHDGKHFRFSIEQNHRNDTSRHTRHQEWVLYVQFNPSRWMPLVRNPHAESVSGKNYVAGNSKAFHMALDDLQKIFESRDFACLREFSGEILDVCSLKLNRVDEARDAKITMDSKRLQEEGFESIGNWELVKCHDLLGLFINSSPARIKEFDSCRSRNFHLGDALLKQLKGEKNKSLTRSERQEIKNFERLNALGNPLEHSYNSLYRCVKARQDVFYIKKVFTADIEFTGAQIRFEHRLVSRKEIRKSLGTDTLTGLYELLVKSDRWHEKGNAGEPPLLETLIDNRIQSWNRITEKTKKKVNLKFAPKSTDNFALLLEKLQEEIYKNECILYALAEESGQMFHRTHEETIAYIKETFRSKNKLDKNGKNMLSKKRENIKTFKPLEFADREWVVGFLYQALFSLRPNYFNRIVGLVSGHLTYAETVAPRPRKRGRRDRDDNYKIHSDLAYKRDQLIAHVKFYLDFYDGDFPGFSAFEKRQLAIERLTYAIDGSCDA